MKLSIDKNLKELRVRQGKRQEDLAVHLGVSAQTVSKWERGENLPDLTLIPAIACYYDVTVDDLLGVGEIRRKERVEHYHEEGYRLLNAGKMAECIALWREARKEFPNDLHVLSNLSFALFFQPDDGKEKYEEVIALDERILRESTDQILRDNAIQRLCLSYNALGNQEKAREYAQKSAHIASSQEILLSGVLEGGEGEAFNKNLLLQFLSLIYIVLQNMDFAGGLAGHEFYTRLLDAFFDDGFMGDFGGNAALEHLWCARAYAERGMAEKGKFHIEKAVRCARQFDGLGEEFSYQAELFRGLKNNPRVIRNAEASEVATQCGFLLHGLTGSEGGVFDQWREEEWFQEAVRELQEARLP